jgi:hypothetical protein
MPKKANKKREVRVKASTWDVFVSGTLKSKFLLSKIHLGHLDSLNQLMVEKIFNF